MSTLPWLIIVPLLWAALATVLPARWRATSSWPGLLLLLAASAQLFVEVRAEGVLTVALGGWPEPLGIGLRADGLATLFVLLTVLVALPVAMHAAAYLREHPPGTSFFWPLLWFLIAALNGIWLAADLFNLYVGLEVLTLTAVGLVALSGSDAIGPALRYLLAALLGSMAYLLGVALLYGSHGTLAMAQLAGALQPGVTTTVAIGLMTAGLAIKTALFPLHGWLPPAHGNALTPVSALLSALVIKASFYILVRLWIHVSGTDASVAGAQLLGALGGLAVFWGGWQALRAARVKAVVAYSTVAQLGYLFLLFPLMIGTSKRAAELAWDGALFHAIAHGFAKAAMFLAAGNLVRAFGAQVSNLDGASRLMSLSLLSFGLAGVSLMGLPPSGGFVAKWLLMQSALLSGQWWWIVVLAGGSLLTAAYLFRIFQSSYLEDPELREAPRFQPLLDLPPLLLAAAAIALGLASFGPLEQLRIDAPLEIGPVPGPEASPEAIIAPGAAP